MTKTGRLRPFPRDYTLIPCCSKSGAGDAGTSRRDFLATGVAEAAGNACCIRPRHDLALSGAARGRRRITPDHRRASSHRAAELSCRRRAPGRPTDHRLERGQIDRRHGQSRGSCVDRLDHHPGRMVRRPRQAPGYRAMQRLRRAAGRIIRAASACLPLPLPYIEASLREIEYAFDTLKADGVGLLTSYRRQVAGRSRFAPVMDELNRRRAVVYTHPTTANCCRNLVPDLPAMIE